MEKHTYFKWGGIAALAEAASFLAGFAVFLAVLAPARYADPSLALGDQLAFLSHNHTWLYGWYFVIYILFGIVLVILVISLHELLAPSANWMSIASVFGLLWAGLVIASGMVVNTGIAFIVEHAQADAAQAATLWLGLDLVVNGLGGGNEVVGSLWLLLVSLAMREIDYVPAYVSVVGVTAAVSGILTLMPAFEAFGALFGLGMIGWFMLIGIILLKQARANPMVQTDVLA